MVSYGLWAGAVMFIKTAVTLLMTLLTRRNTIMKALILKEYGKFVYEETDDPVYGPDEVLIKVAACAICGSDIHGMDGSTGRRIPPVIMGHEASGTIVEAGSNVKGFRKGDRVTFDSTIYCGKCAYCREGKINLCDDRRVLGVSCSEYRQNGAFAEYITVPQRILYPIPDSLSLEHAAMAEPLAIALHAVNISDVRVNSRAVVVGAGMIGLLIIKLLSIAGCKEITAVDIDESKHETAMAFGATKTLTSIKTGTDADLSFEAVGIGPTVNMAVDCLKKGGRLTLVGNLSPDIMMPLQKIVTRGLILKGSCASTGEYPDCIDLIADKKIDMGSFISRTAPLSEGASWFKRLYEKEKGLMKVILCP